MRRAPFVIMTALFLSATGVAAGDPSTAEREKARAELQRGDAAFTGGDHATALKAYEAAHATLALPATGMAVVKARIALGQLVEARDLAIAIARMPKEAGEKPANTEARKAAEKTAADLASRIPSIELEITAPPDVALDVTIDEATVPAAAATAPRKVNPGKRTVRVAAPGFKTFEATVELQEGEARKVPVTLEAGPSEGAAAPPSAPAGGPPTGPAGPRAPAATEPPRDSDGSEVHLLVPIGFSIAGAGLVAGIVGGALSLSSVSSTRDAYGCAEQCPRADQEAIEADLDEARTTAWVSNIGFAVAGAGAILGVVGVALTFTGESGASAETGGLVRGRVNADGFVIEGAF